MEQIDYKRLLKKYMHLIVSEESTTYIHHQDEYFASSELAALEEIEREVREERRKRGISQ